MALWMVRAGSDGGHEDFALESGIAVIGWSEAPALSQFPTREALTEHLRTVYPDEGENTTAHWARQMWTFAKRIQTDDIVALPLKSQPAVAFGRVTGPYQHRPTNPQGANHTLPVKWLRTDVPRSALDQDILYSLGAFMTVCQVQRNRAEERVRALLDNRAVPPRVESEESDEDEPTQPTRLDLTGYGKDLIRERISQRFKAAKFELLIEHLLVAQGYTTEHTPAGADGGADIVAGRGPMGFDPPRIAVQVKSGDVPEGESAIRELQGVLKRFGATQGLFVSWAGFKTSVTRRKRELFFDIRLWDADDVINSLLEHYDKLPDEVRAEVPIMRVWTLATE